MKTYYIFLTKKDIANIYYNDGKQLFRMLENLYKIRKINFKYGLSLYKQLCIPMTDKKILKFLLDNSNYNLQNHYYFKNNNETSLVILKKSCIILKTNSDFSNLLKWLLFYDKKIFICDFENKSYFWLKNIINKTNIYEYI